jgi:hypothetical protein
MRLLSVILTSGSLAFSGCVHSAVQRLAIYNQAKLAQGPERPKFFFADRMAWDQMPDLIPFAVTSYVYDSNTSEDDLGRRSWWNGQREKADVVILREKRRELSGLIYSEALFCRIAPSKLGIRSSDDGVVFAIHPETKAASGLLEGDKIITIGGMRIEGDGRNSEQLFYRWGLKPGTEVVIVWLRPGGGRMEGRCKAIENPPVHLAIGDAIDWKPPTPPPSSTGLHGRR